MFDGDSVGPMHVVPADVATATSSPSAVTFILSGLASRLQSTITVVNGPLPRHEDVLPLLTLGDGPAPRGVGPIAPAAPAAARVPIV